VKNVNGGVLWEYSLSYGCKQNPSEKSIHNEIITSSKLFDVKQDQYDNLFIHLMENRAKGNTKQNTCSNSSEMLLNDSTCSVHNLLLLLDLWIIY